MKFPHQTQLVQRYRIIFSPSSKRAFKWILKGSAIKKIVKAAAAAVPRGPCWHPLHLWSYPRRGAILRTKDLKLIGEGGGEGRGKGREERERGGGPGRGGESVQERVGAQSYGNDVVVVWQ